jgi:hypothetical protein
MRHKYLKVFSAVLFFFFTYIAAAQDSITITGIVTTADRFPLNKVKIVVDKSKNVAYSDSSGLFSIVCKEKDVLVFSAKGFRDKKLKPGKETNYKVDLSYIDTDAAYNNAIINGHISEAELQKVVQEKAAKNAKDYSKYNSIFELISSEIYNVRVTGGGVYLKATRSMNANQQVLYVVDDKITPDISYISPLYVKSIEFIDDVSASQWGSKGANGVLKIYLK